MQNPIPWKWVIPVAVLFTLLTFLVSGNSFFWDTIQLGSRHAHWFYDHDFRFLTLDPVIDSGHPPLLGFYLASVWKIFGRSLWISHFAMLPFLIGIVIQAGVLSKKLFPDPKRAWIGFLFILIEPTLLAQSILISPDIILVFFFLLGVNSMLSGNKVLHGIAIAGLGLISLRGMMTAFGLFISEILIFRRNDDGIKTLKIFKRLMPYLPGALLSVSWLCIHYAETGWIGFYKFSSWNESFETVGISGMLKNIALVGWRFLDFGKIIWWILACFLVVNFFRYKKPFSQSARITGLLFFITLLCYLPSTLPYAGLTGHRYFLVPFIFFGLFIYELCLQWFSQLSAKAAVIAIFIFLISGHLWRYPEGIAMGWDATLGHYGWYKSRNEMLEFISAEKIPLNSIGSTFPAITSNRIADLGKDIGQMHEKDISIDSLVVYSNLMNGFSNKEIAELRKNWKIKKETRHLGISLILFEK